MNLLINELIIVNIIFFIFIRNMKLLNYYFYNLKKINIKNIQFTKMNFHLWKYYLYHKKMIN